RLSLETGGDVGDTGEMRDEDLAGVGRDPRALDGSGESDLQAEDVHLSLPARSEYVRLARVTASGLASRLGFSWDEVEDLRLAVDELCFALMGADPAPGLLELRYRMSGASLEVEGRFASAGGSPALAPRLSPLADQILSALVDEHELRPGGGDDAKVWLRKARAEIGR
ncbi:MAG: hypothetical protein ACRDYD_02875, partial [Acidimicrobiales bacterium]